VEALRGHGVHVETGVFGAKMEVGLVNDGPVTVGSTSNPSTSQGVRAP
jgi:D-tyrosyl-tRNA(Tyr) deacylase